MNKKKFIKALKFIGLCLCMGVPVLRWILILKSEKKEQEKKNGIKEKECTAR